MNLRRFTALSTFLLLSTGPASTAFAWDSAARDLQHNLNSQPVHWVPHTGTTEDRHWLVEVAKDRIGAHDVGGPWDRGISSIYQCPPDFDASNNFDSCVTGHRYDLGGAGWGWLQLRKAADSETDSEHFLIAREAARQAGLLNASKIFAPFFVRYPTRNARIASPTLLTKVGDSFTGRYLRDPSSNLVVGQSWLPTPIGVADAHAVREVSLLELAQLPDWSNNVADWAAGNELCPFSDLDGAFDGTLPDVEACHRFELAMGALNVTHFAPLNRMMWKHYHNIAKQRMVECESLSSLKQQFYGGQYDLASQTLRDNEPRVSPDDTEVHECEREAMVYEMFAQHFMQDAWSTGHMWKRWGETTMSRFPEDFSVNNWAGTPTLGPDYLPEEAAPRQATIALLVAAIAGTVHGAKSKIVSIATSLLGPGNFLLAPWITDDPLNGPTFAPFDPPAPTNFLDMLHPPKRTSKVHWLDATGVPRPGAGDMFWAPEDASQGAVSSSEDWTVQRDTLIRCTAASMVDVYSAGSGDGVRAHGPISRDLWPAGLQDTLDQLNDDAPNNECWDHWATNESMRAALGIDSMFDGQPYGSWPTFLANTLIYKDRAAQVGFTKDDGPASLVASRDVFLSRLQKRMNSDVDNIRESYVANYEAHHDGTQSARGIDPKGGAITLINTLPIADPTAETKLPDLVPYVDLWQPQNPGTNDVTPTPTDLNSAMSRMFWRGNIARTCRDSLDNDAADLNALRARCIAAAADDGGDADACTACVNLAEIHVPYCTSNNGLGPSKCSALSTGDAPGVPAGLPGWWFDGYGRAHGLMGDDLPEVSNDACAPPYTVALDWCTGTQEGSAQDYWVGDPQKFLCHKDAYLGDSYAYYGTHEQRVGTVLTETSFSLGNWVPQMVIARTSTTTEVPGAFPCGFVPQSTTHSYDKFLNAVKGNAPLSERVRGPQAFPEYPRCGTIQRSFGVNRGCQEAGQLIGVSVPTTWGIDPNNGSSFNGTVDGQDSCSFNLPREFQKCPVGLQCAAGGECVAGRGAPGLVVISPPTIGSEP